MLGELFIICCDPDPVLGSGGRAVTGVEKSQASFGDPDNKQISI